MADDEKVVASFCFCDCHYKGIPCDKPERHCNDDGHKVVHPYYAKFFNGRWKDELKQGQYYDSDIEESLT